MKYVVTAVPTDAVPVAWRRAAPHLARAVKHSGGRYDMQALFRFVRAGKGLLWLVLNDEDGVSAAFTTRIANYPLKAILAVDFIGGDGVGDWLTLVTDKLDEYVAANDLDGVETVARKGWVELLAARGWHQTMMFYEKGH